MRTSLRPRVAPLAIAAVLIAGGVGSASVGDVDRMVAINDIRVGDTAITGTIANLTGDQIVEVSLLVSDRFLWKNERSPGPDDPSRGRVETFEVVVAPGTSVPFRIDRAPLPSRADGRFVTDVHPIRVETLVMPEAPTTPAAAATPVP